MPYVMGLEGPQLSALDRVRGQLYAVAPKSVVRAQLNGPLDVVLTPIKLHPLALVLGIAAGLWLAGSKQGQALKRKVLP